MAAEAAVEALAEAVPAVAEVSESEPVADVLPEAVHPAVRDAAVPVLFVLLPEEVPADVVVYVDN